jgi:hypothetical protein
MRYYLVAVNGQGFTAKASSARVAAGKVLRRFTDKQLEAAVVSIRAGLRIKYAYRYRAEVPCEPEGAWKTEFVSAPVSKQQAQMGLVGFRVAHPEYRVVRIRRVEVQ